MRGAWLGLKYVIPVMAKRGGGSIVIVSSVAGIHGYANVSAYVTSKHAVVGMMRTAALECVPLKIRVNTVNPAPIETRMMRSLEEMRRVGTVPAAEGERWLAAMKQLFPDVNDGDRLTGVHRPGEAARFHLNDRFLGEVRDGAFARLFFSIWLSPKTSEPKLRAALLGLA